MSPGKVHLAPSLDSEEDVDLDVDALVVSTGYSAKPTISFSPTTLHSDLGLPTNELTPEQQSFWSELDEKADLSLVQRFPQLIQGPPPPEATASATGEPSKPPVSINLGAAAEVSYTPWRLYRGIAPPGLTASDCDKSLIFIGMFSNIANSIRLEIQCLWGLAYLENKLAHLASGAEQKNKIYEETALFQRYTQHRAPYGHGRFYPDLVFDQLPYWDTLLRDLGLETRRKGGVLGLRELFEPYTQDDYRGIVGEWIGKVGGKDQS